MVQVTVTEQADGTFATTRVEYTPTWVEMGTYRVLPMAWAQAAGEGDAALLAASWDRTVATVAMLGTEALEATSATWGPLSCHGTAGHHRGNRRTRRAGGHARRRCDRRPRRRRPDPGPGRERPGLRRATATTPCGAERPGRAAGAATARDRLYGGAGADRLYGEGGGDTLWGGPDGDALDGGEGDDRLLGHEGDDLLVGGPGVNYLWGGWGSDTLVGYGPADTLAGETADSCRLGGIVTACP